MSSSKNKKIKLFHKFSHNLNWVLENINGQIRNEESGQTVTSACICPLCLEIFNEKCLLPTAENPLTVEHVPPQSLGGKAELLTCQKCNSKSGHKLDNHLLKRLLEMDFEAFLPNSETRATFKLNGNKVNGTVKIDDKGSFVLDLNTTISDPKQSEQFMKDIVLPKTIHNPTLNWYKNLEPQRLTPEFAFAPRNTANTRRAEIALLRIAYLYACAQFGHSFFICQPSLNAVRKQILNPDQDILPSPYWIKFDFADEWDGINLIREPEDLRCFLIIFNLKTKSKKRKIAIALPGFSDTEPQIYKNIEKNLCSDEIENCTVILDHIGDFNYLEKKDYCTDAHLYWKKINSEVT